MNDDGQYNKIKFMIIFNVALPYKQNNHFHIYIFILFTMDVFGLFKKILVVKLEWSWMKTFCILASITLLPFGVRVDVFL